LAIYWSSLQCNWLGKGPDLRRAPWEGMGWCRLI